MSVTLALLGDRYKSHRFNTFTHTHLLSPSRGGWGGGSLIFSSPNVRFSLRHLILQNQFMCHALLLRAPIKKLRIYTSLFSASQVMFRLPLFCRAAATSHEARTPCPVRFLGPLLLDLSL